MAQFNLLTLGIAMIATLCILYAAYGIKDSLHPFVFIMPMVLYLYVWMPAQLTHNGELRLYQSPSELTLVQQLNFLCLVGLAFGILVGGHISRESLRRMPKTEPETIQWRRQLGSLATLMGCVAIVMHLYTLRESGGFIQAYSHPYGGGWYASSGVVRDLELLSLPAVAFLCLSRAGLRFRVIDYILLTAFALPWLSQGMLAGRRGPTFTAVASVGVAWFMARRTRPSPVVVLAAGGCVGLLMLALVTLRTQIFLGSKLFEELPSVRELLAQIGEGQERLTYGNEYLYGTFVVTHAIGRDDYYWGKRYLVYAFVRPIPRQIWDTKYKDVGMEAIKVNSGTLGKDASLEEAMRNPRVPIGSAPGLFADLFVEFSWAALLAAFVVGWVLGRSWIRAAISGRFWIAVYTCFSAFSIFLIMQTIEAFMVRSIVALVPTWFVWRLMLMRQRPQANAIGRTPATSLTTTAVR